jgi:hypothetical protein
MLDKVVLWCAEFRTDAYTDQCGITHSGHVVLEEVEAKVIDSRIVKGDYSGEKDDFQIGYRAREPKYGRIFECNWEYWPDTSTSPYQVWYETTEDRTEIINQWYNAQICAGRRGHPFVRDNALAIPPLPYCEKHMMCYDESYEIGCYRCDIESRRQGKVS